MTVRRLLFRACAVGVLCVHRSQAGAQDRRFRTDDPVPVDLHHYEFYIFSAVDGTPVELARRGRPSNSTGAPCRACNCTPSCRWAACPLEQPCLSSRRHRSSNFG